MVGADLTMNMIEFFDDASDLERRQIPQSAPPASGGSSRIAYVLRPVLWNIFRRWTFLMIEEVMLSRSMSMLKRSLARLRISDIWRGSLASFNMSYAMLICDGPFSRGVSSTSSPASRRNALTAFSCDLRINSWNLAHSLISMTRSFRNMVFITIELVCQEFIFKTDRNLCDMRVC